MKSRNGFTLIELLVVIAMIGILSSILLTMLNQSRVKSRDGRRISDMKQVQVAIHLFETNNGVYPDDLAALVSAGLMPVEPRDPETNAQYAYFPYASRDLSDQCGGTDECISYHLGADLEDANSLVLRTDADADGGAGFIRGSDSTDCSGTPSGKHCYDLRP